MKNKIKLIGIIAFVAVMGLGFFSCTEAYESSLTVGDGTKTTITITGLESKYNGKYASGGLTDTDVEDAYVFLPITQINSGSVTLEVRNDKGSTVSLTGEGYILLWIYDENPPKEGKNKKTGKTEKIHIYQGMTYPTDIKPGNNSVAFSSFQDKTEEFE